MSLHRRLAELYLELSQAHAAMADAEEEPLVAPPAPPKTRQRRGPRVPRIDISDAEREAGDAALKRCGLLSDAA